MNMPRLLDVWSTIKLWDVTHWRDFATVIGAVIALATLMKSVLEYTKASRQKRAEQVFALSDKLTENPQYTKLCCLLDLNSQELSDIPFPEKRDFLGLFEEVALMVNSKLLNPRVAHYMFGYYAIRCWESEYFWITVNKNSKYWALFRDFASSMKAIEDGPEISPRELKF